MLSRIDALTARLHCFHAARRSSTGNPPSSTAQLGAVVRLGRAAGVPTPIFDTLYAALLPQERKARGAA